MANLWDMTDEEISQLSDEEIQASGYLWNPEKARQARVQETVRQAAMAAKDPTRQFRPPSRMHDAATGKVTEDPGGWTRVHDASQQQAGPEGGLAAMLAQSGGDQEVVTAAQEIEGIPGGMELLSTFAAEEMMKSQGIPKTKAKKVRLYKMGGSVSANPYGKNDKRHGQWNKKYVAPGGNGDIPGLARGGSTRQAAAKTRRAGRGDDSMMLHMSPEEYEVITSMWGEPDVNPNTGIGEYGFLSKIWKKVKKGVKKVFKSKAFQMIAPIALSIFMPGLGTAIGGALTGGALGATGSAIVGNAIVQGGLGAATGGKEGAIAGALSGGLGAAAGAYGKGIGESLGLSGKTADVVGSALVRGGGEAVTGGDFTSGAITGGLGAMTRGTQERMGKDVRRSLGFQEDVPEGQLFARRVADPTDPQFEMSVAAERPMTSDELLTGASEGADVAQARTPTTASPVTPTDPLASPTAALTLPQLAAKYALPVGAAALGAMGAAGSADYDDSPPDWWGRQGDNTFGENLPVYTMNRQFRGLPGQADYFTYGQAGSPQSGQHLFMAPEPFAGERGTPTAPSAGLAAVVEATQRRNRSGRGRGAPARRTGQTTFVAQGGYMPDNNDYWTQNEDVPNTIPTVSREGGHHVRGPGTGRSDDIEALLSDGEYVIDAESVALLGDGSGDAGARRLDEMRQELRKHKATKLKKGEFSHKAKKPVRYMRDVRKLKRKANYEYGGTANVAGPGPIPPTRAAGSNV